MSEHDDPIPFPHKPESPICLCGRINARHCPVHHENVHLGALEALLDKHEALTCPTCGELKRDGTHLPGFGCKPEPPPAQAPREWWLAIIEAESEPRLEAFNDVRHPAVATAREAIHVIEYAAYERLERQLAEANIERESIGKSFASLEQELTQASAELAACERRLFEFRETNHRLAESPLTFALDRDKWKDECQKERAKNAALVDALRECEANGHHSICKGNPANARTTSAAWNDAICDCGFTLAREALSKHGETT